MSEQQRRRRRTAEESAVHDMDEKQSSVQAGSAEHKASGYSLNGNNGWPYEEEKDRSSIGSEKHKENGRLTKGPVVSSHSGNAGRHKTSRKKFTMSSRLLLCCILFVFSAILSISSFSIGNWLSHITKDYGNYAYRTAVARNTLNIGYLTCCLGSILAFVFDEKDKKKSAVLSVVFIVIGLYATELVNYFYHLKNGFFEILGNKNPAADLKTSLLMGLIYPAILLAFVLFNKKLGKISLAFMIFAVLQWLWIKNISVLTAAACCVGFAKHFDFAGRKKTYARNHEDSFTQQQNRIPKENLMEDKKMSNWNGERIVKAVVFLAFALVVLFSFETAADLIARGGEGISDIESVGGKTLEEAYYYQLGFVYEGYALVVRTLGRVLAVILAHMGAKK